MDHERAIALTYTKQDSELILSTLDKGLYVLEVLANMEGPKGATLAELSRLVSMHRSTLFRILTTLHGRGYVDRDRITDRYHIGMHVLSLPSAVLRRLDIRQIARPTLQALCTETQELVHLTVLNEGSVVTIERLESTHTLSLRVELGDRRPVHCTATGKVFLAHLPATEIDQILAPGMHAITPRTITSREVLEKQLDEVRYRGFAWDDEEFLEGVRCVAAPVFGYDGTVRAAVSVVTPSMRTPWERMWRLEERVRVAAEEISGNIGHTGTHKTDALVSATIGDGVHPYYQTEPNGTKRNTVSPDGERI